MLCGFLIVLTTAKWRKLLSFRPVNYIILGYQPNHNNQMAVMKTAFGATFFAPALHRVYLESIMTGNSKQNRIFQGKYCSLTACQDSELELSCLYGNPLVKPLPRNQILSVLRRKKGYLQTAGLICPPESQSILTEILIQSGINRIFPAGKMSDTVLGEAHDGEYPLRRYTRIVNTIK